jgi:hypothetical protein
MKTQLRKTFGGFILGISLLLGIGIMSSTTAQAQYRDQDQYRQEQIRRAREAERIRREQERNRNNNDWWNRNRQNRDYNNGGYNNGGYDNYPNYGGSYNSRQTALNAGYNEGMKAGREDRRRGDRYDFRDEGAFQSASKDYNSRMGDRGAYQAYFRQAFATGYADGYRGY